jgi:lipoic acid synthetase
LAGRPPVLRVRWLGAVPYEEALALQHALWQRSSDDHLLLLEHPHTYTLGVRGREEHLLAPAEEVGATVVRTDRGGDITYHGPGQLVGYPIRSVPTDRGGGLVDTAAYVADLEQLLIDALATLGVRAERLAGHTGVWIDAASPRPRKIAAIGVRLSRGRSMHGFALNVEPDLAFFDRIVPCGITDKGVTSLRREGSSAAMRDVVEVVAGLAAERWAPAGGAERADAVWRERPDDLSPFSRGAGPGAVPGRASAGTGSSVRLLGRLAAAGVDAGTAIEPRQQKPDWLRAPVRHTAEVLALRSTMRDLDLVTVCEEAGCPNLSDCWADGTATFMINGERCTRACGFCLVDTRKPQPLAGDEPERVAEAVAQMGVRFAVVTAVARDDLTDGGAAAFAATIDAIRTRAPGTQVEVLIPDCRGDAASLARIFDARPDVLNHNLETVLRLQRAVRPSAGYARSLAVLARAKEAGLLTKSGLILGMDETHDEVLGALGDLAGVGADVVTLGQYLRPTTNHLPVARWWHPDEFAALAEAGEALGIKHVEASPLTRSSYHARQAAEAAAPVGTLAAR